MGPQYYGNTAMDGVNDSILMVLGELKGKLDAVLAGQISLDKRIEQQEGRINKLENSKAWVLGAAAAVSTLIGYLMKVAGH